MSNQILVFGCNGQLGKSISNIFPDSIKYSRAECDFNNLEDISKTILRIKPEVIINCVAYTDVNNSETNIKKALKINSIAVKVIALSANIIDALVIHFSTDYVFDGFNSESYTENSSTNPINNYGKSKLQGENKLIKFNKKFLIIRTSWVYGNGKSNFVYKIIKNIHKKKIAVVDYEFSSPTYTKSLAIIVKLFVDKYFDQSKTKFEYGIYNFAGNAKISRYTFAKKIIEIFKKYYLMDKIRIEAISKKLESNVKRPQNSFLNCEKICKYLGIDLPAWDSQLETFFEENHAVIFKNDE
tara:strand:- start:60 stop:953 length:894 start_codon:yes stop_codon:yes gene_type:complete